MQGSNGTRTKTDDGKMAVVIVIGHMAGRVVVDTGITLGTAVAEGVLLAARPANGFVGTDKTRCADETVCARTAGMRTEESGSSDDKKDKGDKDDAEPPNPASGMDLDPADTQGRMSKAGRAQQKHGDRPGSAFDRATGTPDEKNEQGQETLEKIVTSPTRTDEPNRFGGTDVLESPGRRDARFDAKGNSPAFSNLGDRRDEKRRLGSDYSQRAGT